MLSIQVDLSSSMNLVVTRVVLATRIAFTPHVGTLARAVGISMPLSSVLGFA